MQKDIKEDVHKLEDEIRDQVREQFGQAAQSQLQFFGTNGLMLDGQEIVPNISKAEEGRSDMAFLFGLRNVGNGLTGPIWLKLYTQKELPTFIPSTDEPNYPFEARILPKDLRPDSLPGKYSVVYTLSNSWPTPSRGRHAVLFKAFYGSGKVASAPFYLIVK